MLAEYFVRFRESVANRRQIGPGGDNRPHRRRPGVFVKLIKPPHRAAVARQLFAAARFLTPSSRTPPCIIILYTRTYYYHCYYCTTTMGTGTTTDYYNNSTKSTPTIIPFESG